MKIVTFVVAAALLCTAFPSSLRAQREQEEKPAGHSAAASVQALAGLAKVRLDKAVGIALKARPGTAVGVEMEGRGEGESRLPVFEVMVFGKDRKVYEVFVNAVDGSVVADEECKDEEDVEEAAAVMARKGPRVSLVEIVAESRALLHGVCVEASLAGKQATTVTLNRGRRIKAQWQLSDGELVGLQWLDARSKKAAGDDDEDDDDDEDEGEEHGAAEPGHGKKHRQGESSEAGEEKEGQHGGEPTEKSEKGKKAGKAKQ